ncbi:MAG: hypothetical protein ACP5HU_06250, partial [Phycisphaerae bacterium]
LWYLLLAIPTWVLATFLPRLVLRVFPLASGWAYGNMIFSGMFPESIWWSLGGGAIGLLSMYAVCSVIVAIVTSPRAHTVPAKVEEVIRGLNNILLCLFAALLDRYCRRFPTDPRETNRHRAGIVLNELVGTDLPEGQFRFRQANVEFFEHEKAAVMKDVDLKTVVLAFLAAKAGLYQWQRLPGAQEWTRKAQMLDEQVDIPQTFVDIQETIYGCLESLGQAHDLPRNSRS